MNNGAQILERRTMRIVSRRILPLVLVFYAVAYMDRVSLGYAQLKMGADLGIDPALFGFVASIFFAGYMLFEVPSNAILYRTGARIWLTRIGITWGVVTIATGFVQNEGQLIAARVLLGIAEAGLAPGVIFYMASFFPAAYKGRVSGWFFVGSPLAGVVAGPLAGIILDHVTWGGLASWRWVFIIFGVPAVIVGVLLFILLSDKVDEANWLKPDEKNWLTSTIASEQAQIEPESERHGAGMLAMFKEPSVLLLAFTHICITSGTFGLAFWTPQIVKGIAGDVSATAVGILSALPFLLGAISMLLVAAHSDRTNQRTRPLTVVLILAAVPMMILPFVGTAPVLAMVLLCMSAIGAYGYVGPFWAIVQQQFVGRRAAIGIAAVTALGNTGGLVAPYVFGLITQATGSTSFGVLYLGISLLCGVGVVMLTRKRWINIVTTPHRPATEDAEQSTVPV